ncbi:SDR family oxidoreductase [Streptomyces sp. MMS20-AI2-20]|uniref:SDR family oxidoreductase n=1 Tax=Streptomyces sp. MMS20-AI2-20 TaxID=2925835 RepID=UPI001F600ADD|nr:NmrA family transcriptional regulator [Streptomyces sp. MMS20-AI2-20]MCI4146599.1 NmrA family transcriptional regulator [Streptomyces sp. MMS20-AI2-20]
MSVEVRVKIVVVGSGTLVGDALVDVAGRRGHEVRALSPGTGVDPWAGQDLLRHLRGAHAVIDVAVAPPADEAATLRFHRACTTALLTAGTTAGVAHHVVFSLTGSGSAPQSGLFRAKAEQEALVRDSALPHTLVHATRLFDFIATLASLATPANAALLAHAAIQPHAAHQLAETLTDIATGPPANTTVELDAPHHWGLDHFLTQHLTDHH